MSRRSSTHRSSTRPLSPLQSSPTSDATLRSPTAPKSPLLPDASAKDRLFFGLGGMAASIGGRRGSQIEDLSSRLMSSRDNYESEVLHVSYQQLRVEEQANWEPLGKYRLLHGFQVFSASLAPERSERQLLDEVKYTLVPCALEGRSTQRTWIRREFIYAAAGWSTKAIYTRPSFISDGHFATALPTSISLPSEEAAPKSYFVFFETVERATISIDKESAKKHISQDFLAALKKASTDTFDRRRELMKVFAEWGHVVATEVVLGVARKITVETTNIDLATGDLIAANIHIPAVDPQTIKIQRESKSFTSIQGFSSSIRQIRRRALQSAMRSRSISYVGGDPSFYTENIGGDPSFQDEAHSNEWKEASKQFWEVVRVEEVTPILDLLPENLKQSVLECVRIPLLGIWLSREEFGDEFIRGRRRICKPHMTEESLDEGWRYLGHSLDAQKILAVKAYGSGDPLRPILKRKRLMRPRELMVNDAHYGLDSSDDDYISLGTYFTIDGSSDSSDESDMYRPFSPGGGWQNGLAAVRSDLVAPRFNKALRGKGTANEIMSEKNPKTLDLQLLHGMSDEGALIPAVYSLRVDCVKILDD